MRQRLTNPWWLGLVAVAVFTALAMHDFGGQMRIDLEVYRRGGQAVIDGTPIYEQPYGWLPFTYPPLAAIVFSGLAWLPAAVSALLVTLASYVALFGLLLLVGAVRGDGAPAARSHPAPGGVSLWSSSSS